MPALAVLSIATAAHAAVAQAPDFDRDVRPVLAAKCFACHGPDAEAREAGLRLDTFEGATTALRSGRRAVVPGDPAASVLLARVSAHDPDDRMPPVGEPLTGDEIESIRRWIEAGAAYTDPWAFQPMQAVDAPPVRDAAWCFDEASPIDRFVLATREAAGLAAPARDATPEALLRRLSFDLRGLPPDPADLAAFADDPSDARYDALVERYLVDPAFGERWAREAEAAFARMPVACHLAMDRAGEICGFACHDVTFRGFFGPAGVREDLRGQGLGTALLMRALHSLAEAGYAYAVIGGSGDDDFYKKAVGAVPIADSTPGPYGSWASTG